MRLDALGMQTSKINQFIEKGILTVEDLAMYFPRKYYDFRKITKIRDIKDGDTVAVVGTIKEVKSKDKYVQAKVVDDTGRSLYVVWFRQPYIAKILTKAMNMSIPYIFCGKVQVDPFYHSRKMTSPYYYGPDIQRYQKMIPVYPKIKGMSDEFLLQAIQSALGVMMYQEKLEPHLLSKYGLAKFSKALKGIHQPENENELEEAKKRFVFDDLFEFGMQMYESEGALPTTPYQMLKFNEVGQFLKRLPFELTDGQREALRKISIKMKSGQRVNALVQGDVGCGKTIVAILLMMVACENGFQSALMAPTGVLAKQHYEDLAEKMKGSPYKVAYLSGDMKVKERKAVLKGIQSGEIHFVVGTHAIISKDVVFSKLALTIVDEEHRFGVVQRNQLREKAKQGVHHINMSATPIPRSLALAMYGDQVDVHTIKTLPKGRKPVRTVQLTDELRCYNGMHQQIQQGRQCYVVCPLIEDSESEALQDIDSVEKTYEKMTKHFAKNPEVKISMISGKMKPEEVTAEIERFARNETNILISTTIIEVGVNVPNSTMIVVKNAERFGLAQLHQLRGRVGRGNYDSYCVLLSERNDNPKLHAMCATTDGFQIAEKDLALRGTGDFIGTKQTGENKYVMLMLAHQDLYLKIKEEVRAIHRDPKRLSHYRYLNVLDYEEGA